MISSYVNRKSFFPKFLIVMQKKNEIEIIAVSNLIRLINSRLFPFILELISATMQKECSLTAFFRLFCKETNGIHKEISATQNALAFQSMLHFFSHIYSIIVLEFVY